MNELYTKCEEIAVKAHGGQKRRNGDAYITHPLRVALQFSIEKLKCVAVLHDVLEDTAITADNLFEHEIPAEIVDAVRAISKVPGEPYLLYLKRVANNPLAREVKMGDLLDNLRDLEKGSMRDKYELTLFILSGGRL
jgi:(p)ppGpp synthase/HD superfamily hydrolase